MKVELTKELKVYKEILMEDTTMFVGEMSGYVTYDEYLEVNELGTAIEGILEAKYGEQIINKVRWGTI